MKQVDNIVRYIDHTLLKQDASEDRIKELCKEALAYQFAAVCVNPCYVPLCASALKGSNVKVCTVIGFPLGASTTETKVYEAEEAVKNGADEVDMVINVGMVKSRRWEYVRNDIYSVVEAVRGKALVKVIIETCLLTDDEKKRVCTAAKEAGADFVKTSTGFSSDGAKAEDIVLMRLAVGPQMGVKASGGIHTAAEALEMILAGATRIGTSSGIQIVGCCSDYTDKVQF